MRETLIDKPEIEYIGGRAYPKVSPRRTHSMVQRNLLRILEDAAGERGAVGPEWRFKLEHDTSPHRAGLLANKIEQYFSHGGILVLDVVDPAQRMVYAHTASDYRI